MKYGFLTLTLTSLIPFLWNWNISYRLHRVWRRMIENWSFTYSGTSKCYFYVDDKPSISDWTINSKLSLLSSFTNVNLFIKSRSNQIISFHLKYLPIQKAGLSVFLNRLVITMNAGKPNLEVRGRIWMPLPRSLI